MKTAQFNVPSIACSNCSGKIQKGLKSLTGIGNISVDLKTQAVNVDFDPQQIQENQIKSSIAEMGYEVT